MVDRNAEQSLRTAMQRLLRGGTVVVLASVSPDGIPSTALCSWIVAKGHGRLLLALDKRSSAYAGIAAGSNHVAMEIMADEILLSIRGTAALESGELSSAPFPCALVSVAVDEIRDHMVDGLRFSGPRYSFADVKSHRRDIERAILAELEAAP